MASEVEGKPGEYGTLKPSEECDLRREVVFYFYFFGCLFCFCFLKRLNKMRIEN